MKNILALLICFIYGGSCVLVGQYIQEQKPKPKQSCQQVQLVPLPTKYKTNKLNMAALQGAIPMSALRGKK